MPRCCHCGGSLYLEPVDSFQAPVDPAQLRKLFTAEESGVASA
jgi:hypothetical protein